jgi:hypothetical protein
MSNLESRYGRSAKPTPKWFWPVIAAIGVSLGVAWAAWSAASNDRPWQAEVYGYEVIDDNHTKVSLRVYRKEPVEVVCTVYAQAIDKVYVGEKEVVIPADAPDPTRVTTTIRTQYRAVTAEIRSCEVR